MAVTTKLDFGKELLGSTLYRVHKQWTSGAAFEHSGAVALGANQLTFSAARLTITICADLLVYLQGTLKILLKRLACFSNFEPALALPLLTVRDSESRLFYFWSF